MQKKRKFSVKRNGTHFIIIFFEWNARCSNLMKWLITCFIVRIQVHHRHIKTLTNCRIFGYINGGTIWLTKANQVCHHNNCGYDFCLVFFFTYFPIISTNLLQKNKLRLTILEEVNRIDTFFMVVVELTSISALRPNYFHIICTKRG